MKEKPRKSANYIPKNTLKKPDISVNLILPSSVCVSWI